MYEYNAVVEKVIDGDTVQVDVDLGFHVHIKNSVRLLGLNAPEHNTADGAAAKDWLSAKLPVGTQIVISTQKNQFEKFGRMLATIVLKGEDVNAALIASGHAKPWDGKGERPV